MGHTEQRGIVNFGNGKKKKTCTVKVSSPSYSLQRLSTIIVSFQSIMHCRSLFFFQSTKKRWIEHSFFLFLKDAVGGSKAELVCDK